MSTFAGAGAEGDSRRRDANELVMAVATELADEPSPFAVMGVPADASGPQLRRAAERARIARRVSTSAGGDTGAEEAIRRAAQRLADPRARLVHELLWYRTGSEDGSEGGAEPDPATIERWLATPAADRPPVAVHNLAAQSLRHLLYGPSQVPVIAEAALATMTAHLASPATAAYAGARAAALADRRLTPGDTAQLLAALRTVVPLVAIRRAVKLVEEERRDEARQVMDVVAAQVPEATLQDLIGQVAEPWRRTVTAAATRASAAAGAEPGSALPQAETFLDQSARDRAVLDVLLAHDPPRRTEVYDEVTTHCLDAVIGWWNRRFDEKTQLSGDLGRELEPALAILRRLAPFPCSSLVGDRVSRNIATMGETLDACRQVSVTETCWFCKTGANTKPIVVHLHRDVQRQYGRVQFRTAQVPVPRCQACVTRSSMTVALGIFVVAPAVIFGAWLTVVLFSMLLAATGGPADTTYLGRDATAAGGVPGLFIWAAIVGGLVALWRARTPDRPPRNSYPPLAAALREGWMLGAKPVGTR